MSSVPMSLERGLFILRQVVAESGGLSFSAIQQRIGLPNTSVARLLNALVELNYLEKRGTLYLPGPELHGFGVAETTERRLRHLCARSMQMVSERFSQTVILLYYTGVHAVCLERYLQNESLSMCAVGHVIQRMYDGPWSAVFMTPIQWKTLFGDAAMRVHLRKMGITKKLVSDMQQQLREDGYCYSHIMGKLRVVAPIYSASGEAIAAVAIGAIDNAVDAPVVHKEYGPALLEITRSAMDKL